MSRNICLVFLFIALFSVIPSSAAAVASIQRRWNNTPPANTQCCPIAVCLFQQGSIFDTRKRHIDVFDGFIQFTETFNNSLYVSGFLDFENATTEQTADHLGFDVHVTKCNDLSFNNIEGGISLDDNNDIFDQPFFEVVHNKTVSDVVDLCCIVAKDVRNNNSQNDGQNNGGQNNDGQNNDGQNNDGQNNDGQNNDGQNNDGQNNDGQNNQNNQNNGHQILGVARVKQAVQCKPTPQIILGTDFN
ncbi:9544_t:CDS:1 [Paraglomus occultum]|uniref:9544_t:CDS:1 n=1 Tax=Paraglomus occultum TaxID=144539 RepID=A0A9N9CC22_9GLOM|nr:9544_t:CDS:1 [Paraglomus occultum]